MKFRVLVALNVVLWTVLAFSGHWFFKKEIRNLLGINEPEFRGSTESRDPDSARDTSEEDEPELPPSPVKETGSSSLEPEAKPPETQPKPTVDGGTSAQDLLDELRAAKADLSKVDPDSDLDGIVYDAAKRLGDEKVYAYIHDITGLSREEIDSSLSAPEAAQLLYDMAMESQEARYLRPILFGVEVDSQNRVIEAKKTFKDDAKRIYATFEVANIGIKTVIVKWQRVGEEQPFLFTRQVINHKMENNYIWAETPTVWKPGEYLVEIFDPAHRFDPLAGGTYTMTTTADNVIGP
ncbi:MAG: hypothetical protein AB7F75_04915 [Planctomycetota bacterium]